MTERTKSWWRDNWIGLATLIVFALPEAAGIVWALAVGTAQLSSLADRVGRLEASQTEIIQDGKDIASSKQAIMDIQSSVASISAKIDRLTQPTKFGSLP